jgi:protein gp37
MARGATTEGTFHTFNPWWGCTKVSGGCKNCYAEAMSRRYGFDLWGPNAPRRLMSDDNWRRPFRWNTDSRLTGIRHRVFCASMADVFDDLAPEGQFDRLWDVIRATPYIDWLLLTKRPELIARKLPGDWGAGYANLALGTTVEDRRVIGRVPILTAVPARERFLSVEPLIGPIDDLPLTGIDWAWCGAESGPNARPMRPEWAESIRRQCETAGVPCSFKSPGGPKTADDMQPAHRPDLQLALF